MALLSQEVHFGKSGKYVPFQKSLEQGFLCAKGAFVTGPANPSGSDPLGSRFPPFFPVFPAFSGDPLDPLGHKLMVFGVSGW